MKVGSAFHFVLLGVMLWTPITCVAQFTPGQSFSGRMEPVGAESGLTAASTTDGSLYADGTRAINAGHWSDAVTIFSEIAGKQRDHADGALYWKAYAENKQGNSKSALDTCIELRNVFPNSRWIDECGALEIEIRAKYGNPILPKAEQGENLRLLALNALMQQDEKRGLVQIRAILKGDFSERFKEGAVFILARSSSTQARELLTQIAQKKTNAGAAWQAQAAAVIEGKLAASPHIASDTSRALTLDVVVTDKANHPVKDLQSSDFTLLVNNQPQSLASFQAVSGESANPDPPVEAILLLDAINSNAVNVAEARQELARLFKENGGQLTLPTALLVLTDQGANLLNEPTRDGATLQKTLDGLSTVIRPVGKSAGVYGEVDRENLSLRALDRFAVEERNRPGRKLLLWIGQGWWSFARSDWLKTRRDDKAVFSDIVALSTNLREARMTLYSIDPRGAEMHGGNFMYRDFLKGVSTPAETQYGDLDLQVLATQSGGQVLFGSNYITSLIDHCIADASAYYSLTFNSPEAVHPNEYRGIKVKVDKPGLTARTRTGYYADPTAVETQRLPSAPVPSVHGTN